MDQKTLVSRITVSRITVCPSVKPCLYGATWTFFFDKNWIISVNILTPLTREAAIAAVKNVFRPPAFQLLYSASARVNTVKESWSWLLYILWLTFVCCQEMKRPNLHENHQLHNGPVWSPGHRNVEAWIELHATEQWAFSPCKAKRALPARPHTEN